MYLHAMNSVTHGRLLTLFLYVLKTSSPLTQSEAPQRRRGEKRGKYLPPQLTKGPRKAS